MSASDLSVRVAVRVQGTVQGVGFRPYVHRLAGELELAGWVRNDERGVELEVEGPSAAVEAFLARLEPEAPPLAQVESLRSEARTALGERGFAIAASARRGEADAPVAADAATCADCLAELFDPRDRRHRYPFLNCTNCGPRFTIVTGVPYDRPWTTMAAFGMCPACVAEFEDPGDRRFHAQPNACPVCGPQARLIDAGGRELAPPQPAGSAAAPADPLAAGARLLADGAIVAIKGLGGYHLAVRADDEEAVAELRSRKHREERPFALMVADLEAASRLLNAGERERDLLRSPGAPIVLAERRPDARVARALAPGAPELGVMLAYTPLHHLLMSDAALLGVEALVMTSGNLTDEPIAFGDADALKRLATVADAFLVHDRPIHMRTDDSIVRVVDAAGGHRTQMVRRSRGYVPDSMRLSPAPERALLACGAQLKSTFCLARGSRAWVGPHIGDLGSWETLRSFREGIAHFEELFAVSPELVVHDLHPDYLSTAYAQGRDGVELVGVQHHHAHLAAVLAEHGETGPAVGAIYDGTGYGLDGTIWGGELLVGGLRGFRRAGHLRPVRMPGGERAVTEPWRMACAWLAESAGGAVPELPAALAGAVEEHRWAAVGRLASDAALAPVTTSMGRLCDAVAALSGVRGEVSYEGQAAIELEAAADRTERGGYEILWEDGVLDPRPAIGALCADVAAGLSTGVISARFHRGLAAATVRACAELAAEEGTGQVVLAGGVFQNRILLESVSNGLLEAGLSVLVPERLPPNDGAISFGQAAVAAALSPGASSGTAARGRRQRSWPARRR
ncbi:MAG TPA: carbamoyltransferase HypF [Solirubrobacteraceae bacterium]